MTQTVPATAVLGPGLTGLAIGLRVLNLDGTTYAAFATTGVAETSILGTYRKASGVVCPDAGAYIVWGVSGTDYAEATVDAAAPTAAQVVAAIDADPPAVDVTLWKGATAPAMTGDAFARLGAPAGASVSADVAAVKADTAAIADVPTVAEFEARTLLADDYVVVGDLPTAAAVADAVWDEAIAGHASAGSTGAALSAAATAGDPWLTAVPGAYGSGTAGAILGGLPASLANTGATVTVVSAVSGGDVTVYANDTWRFTVTDATLSLSGYEALALVVKRTARQDDDEALLYLRSDDGLVRIAGAAPADAANGTLTSTATSFTALVAIAETAGIAAGKYAWWLKGFDTTPATDEGLTLAVGTFTVADPGLRAIA